MSISRYISHEFKKIDKRRTFGLLGFLFILAFFPVVFSSSKETQETRSQAAPLQGQPIQPTSTIAPTQTSAGVQFSAQASISGGLVPITTSSATTNSPAQLNAEEAYSPQPSIWLFLIPIAVTFFTILFY